MLSDKENIAENSVVASSSNHARNTATSNDYANFDIDAIVDDMPIEDLRDLAKRILKNAKEKSDEKILSQLNFLVNRQQHKGNDQSKDDPIPMSTLLDPSHPDSILSLPPLLRNARSYESDDAAKPVSSASISPTLRTSNAERQNEMPMMPDGNERQDKGKRQLVILCNGKPATGKESMDHDLAMTLCKNMGIIPSVIVSTLSAENSVPTQEEQLLFEAMQSRTGEEVADIPLGGPVYKYPQFFVRSVRQDQKYAFIDYMGDYDTMEGLYVTGRFDSDSLEAVVDPSTTAAKDEKVTLSRFIDQTSSSVPPRAGIASVGEPALPSPRRKSLVDSFNLSMNSIQNDDSSSEGDEDESNATPVKADVINVSTIVEEDEDDDDDDDESEGKMQETGEITKHETVMLKSRKVEPPGAVVLNNHSSRLEIEARTSINAHNFPPVKPAETKSKAMNPFYALNYYSGGKGDDVASTDLAAAIDSKDPPIEQTVDPPGDGSQRDYLPWEKKFVGVGACYLIFHRNDDELNIHYSESPMVNAVGVWTSPDIAKFKESQGLSKCELIGTCASRVTQEYKNFCQGWCQFIKAAKIMDGTVSAIDGLGLPVDFYLYDQGRTIKVTSRDRVSIIDTKVADAIACIPKGKIFPPPGIVGKKWGKLAKKLGGVALFKSLSAKQPDKVENESTNKPQLVPEMSKSEPIPEHESESEPNPMARDESLSTLNTTEVVSPVPEAPKSLTSVIDFETSPPLSNAPIEYKSQPKDTVNEQPACYLVYDPDSSGQLVEHYCKTPIEFAIGRWIPGNEKKIAGFKFKRNHGRNVLIGNCSGGVQGRKNFYSGWCQFVRSAKNMHGDVTLWDTAEGRKGLNVDVCLYYNDNRPTHQTVRMEEGKKYTTKNMIAVACLPKGTPFFDNMTADLLLWLAEGSKHGYSSKM